jgi:hypothetical protein
LNPNGLELLAKESRLIERERKIDPVIIFWTLAIGYGSQLYRTLTELKSEYEVRGNISISDSSWHDGTLIRLHESLADKWPATHSKRVAAGVKVSFLTSAIANGPKSISILPENTSEMKTLKIGPWVKNIILLMDFASINSLFG